jgi:hypothetical protein
MSGSRKCTELLFTGTQLQAEQRVGQLWNDNYGHMADRGNRITLKEGETVLLEVDDFVDEDEDFDDEEDEEEE